MKPGQGQHHPLGWSAVLLIVVTYAHAIVEVAVAVVAVAIAVRVVMSPVSGLVAGRVWRRMRPHRPGWLAASRQAAIDGRAVDESSNGSQARTSAERR